MSTDAVSDVTGGRPWAVACADNLDWLRALPDGCCSLCVTSPPYESARSYGVSFALAGQAWVDWMAPRVVEACRVVAGLVCVNMAGQVRGGSYSPVVEWLVADLTRRHGLTCGPAPYAFFRFGIPGSGGPRYHRRDWEPVYCFARPERLPLGWSDNTSMGHPPKWAPGGEMSHRLRDGQRVSKWGSNSTVISARQPDGSRDTANPSMRETVTVGEAAAPGLFGPAEESAGARDAHGCTASSSRRRTGHSKSEKLGPRKTITREREGQHSQESTSYDPPVLANPGNVVRERYDAEQVRQLLEEYAARRIDYSDVVRCLVGGGQMGSPLAHENEAPFPETLAEFFVRSYAPPGSVVLDPFCGSGTVGAVALRHGRRFLGCDVRESQADLTRRRLGRETPSLFAALPAPEPPPAKGVDSTDTLPAAAATESDPADADAPWPAALTDDPDSPRAGAPSDQAAYELYCALHAFEGAPLRWQALREAGATDEELAARVRAECAGGGQGGPGRVGHRTQVGAGGVKFWLGRSDEGKPTLAGKALLRRAREVLGVPYPGRWQQ